MGRKFIVATGAAVIIAGCGTKTIIVKTVTAGGQSSTSAQSASASTQPASTSSPQEAKVGDTLTLSGGGGLTMAVTVDQVMDPLQVGSDDQADSGQRFVGVQITLKNVGQVAYSDSPSNGATLLSNTNEEAQGQIVTGGPCGNDFQSLANIAPGDTQQGCIPFEMPVGQMPAMFQFTLNSGFANQTGQWSLTGAETNASPSSVSTASRTTGTTTPSSADTSTSPCYEGPCVLSNMPNQCSPGVASTQSVSCGLASNVFYEYFEAQQSGGDTSALSAWSPVTNKYYRASCSVGDGLISCSINGTSVPNAQVVITQVAMSEYSPQQASSYASQHNVGPNG